jgi:hypothetical protein
MFEFFQKIINFFGEAIFIFSTAAQAAQMAKMGDLEGAKKLILR